VTAYPDWFHPNIQEYWNDQFAKFFDRKTGVDIDGLWIDMNEAANFCPYPCSDPEGYSRDNNLPPAAPPVRPSNPRPLPGFPGDFQPSSSSKRSTKGSKVGLPNRDLINPPYMIRNEAGSLSNKTINTDIIHAGEGYAEYDTHNLYGTSKLRLSW
jgi:alpha-glucosidase